MTEKEFNYIQAPAEPMVLEGFAWYEKDREFCRLPQSGLPVLSSEMNRLAWNTAGGTLRFKTDSVRISIKYTLSEWRKYSPAMPATGHSGLDVYAGSGQNYQYIGNMQPAENKLEQVLEVENETGHQDITIYFPTYNGITNIEIGITEGSTISAPTPRTEKGRVVVYGPSIAQGGNASRPACTYPCILSRWLNIEVVNLGFSGNCLGEPEMAHIINELTMRALVMEYDHNAPNPEHLWKTHEPFYKIIREKNPDLPVIFVSKTNTSATDPEDCDRRAAITATYENALKRGENVQFINGLYLMGTKDRDMCTTDGGHPNDLGFYRMAEGIFPVLSKMV